MDSAEEIIGVPELERDIFNQREADYTPPVLLSRLNPKKRASKKKRFRTPFAADVGTY